MIFDPHHVLRAAASAGLPLTGPSEALRLAENEVWRLPGLGVARVARAGQEDAAAREVRVARWLADHEIPAVRPLPVDQPVTTGDGRPVTVWEELPKHQQGSLAEVAKLVRRLHQLPAPPAELGLRPLDPFVRVEERIDAATTLPAEDRRWLRDHHAAVQAAWAELPEGMPHRTIHGDAWPGNLVATARGPLVMDLERFALGPPEWDLLSVAIRTTTTGVSTEAEYAEYAAAYGWDVREWEGYETIARPRSRAAHTRPSTPPATPPGRRRPSTGSTAFAGDAGRGRGAGPASCEVGRLSIHAVVVGGALLDLRLGLPPSAAAVAPRSTANRAR
ncbi:phosphotransferase enzyme family protein [Streptomyces sp. CNQ431]|uniref:phosphotransferase enzyme family protein n=1 Tax=Streptomyces sp. CNQ431 TaxID=1571532 RepID=UPI001F527DE9|nr:aminoglycoside phosphotransferase family protein [Streptomyces sp. CNQ431]